MLVTFLVWLNNSQLLGITFVKTLSNLLVIYFKNCDCLSDIYRLKKRYCVLKPQHNLVSLSNLLRFNCTCTVVTPRRTKNIVASHKFVFLLWYWSLQCPCCLQWSVYITFLWFLYSFMQSMADILRCVLWLLLGAHLVVCCDQIRTDKSQLCDIHHQYKTSCYMQVSVF